jgi:uncharacterized protein YbjT (DUF2867 family)
MKEQNILVIGASGYIGSHLVPCLLENGYKVRCLVRDTEKISGESWFNSVEVIKGDILDIASLQNAFQNIKIVYYLVHSMGNLKGDFAKLDRLAARNAGNAAKDAGVSRIIYLGGLGKRNVPQSVHLKSRHEVGDILRSSGVPIIEFRAAVIIGARSLSFEMIHHLTNRVPVMICPRWVITKTQPISIDDVISYLVAAPDIPGSADRIIDIGGPEILTYRDMMLTVARVLGLKRWLIEVPVLTPRLSSYWVGLVTPIPIRPARALIEGLRHETICENDDARKLFDIEPMPFVNAVQKALSAVLPRDNMIEGHQAESIIRQIEPSHILIDRQQMTVNASTKVVFDIIKAIGGEKGWYYANWLWKIRGFIDEIFGGVGLRRGRRDAANLTVGDSLDFWRVEELEPGRRLLLRAEMKIPGKAWLEFEVESTDQQKSLLTQTARFYPRGLWGLCYWYGVYPIHQLVFKGLAMAIVKKAETSLAN